MLKTRVDDEIWLVHQPDHARVSAYLAAHWGGVNGFARPGHHAPFAHVEALHAEVVLAIAEHDNGWWEWEAAPDFDAADGLPVDLSAVSRERADEGLRRWRLGVPRLAEAHPYVALLISSHAYWLYAFAFDDIAGLDDAFRHPIFGERRMANRLIPDPSLTRAFLDEQASVQRELMERLRRDPVGSAAVAPALLHPSVRLLQLMDALSLLLSFGGAEARSFEGIPRAAWNDRVTITWRPIGDRRIVCDPFPFDLDPLEVYLPARVVRTTSATSAAGVPPLVALHARPLELIRFELRSRA